MDVNFFIMNHVNKTVANSCLQDSEFGDYRAIS